MEKKKDKDLLRDIISQMCYQHISDNSIRLIGIQQIQMNYLRQMEFVLNNMQKSIKIMLNDDNSKHMNFVYIKLICDILKIGPEEFYSMIDDNKRKEIEDLSKSIIQTIDILRSQQNEFMKAKAEMLELIHVLEKEYPEETKKLNE